MAIPANWQTHIQNKNYTLAYTEKQRLQWAASAKHPLRPMVAHGHTEQAALENLADLLGIRAGAPS